LTRTIVSKHHVVRAKNARIAALNLRFLNLNCLVGVALHEIVLTRGVRSQRSSVVLALRRLEASLNATCAAAHYLNTASHLWAVAGTRLAFLSADQTAAHTRTGKNFA